MASTLSQDFMEVTEAAKAHFRGLLDKEEITGMNLRMCVANAGTIHADVSITFCPPGEEELSDVRLHFEDFILFVDKGSKDALNTAVVDFKADGLNGQLSIKAPYLKGVAPKPDSSLRERVQYVIDSEINPNLANHGGRVDIVDILEEKIVVLRFGGGCHGCGMAGVTLKHGIEKTLKEKFPEIVEIRDVTDHTTGEDPYC